MCFLFICCAFCSSRHKEVMAHDGTMIHKFTKASEQLEHAMVDICMYVCISFCTIPLLKLARSVCSCIKHTAVTGQLLVHYWNTMQFNLFHFAHKKACILVCFKLVVNYSGELVTKCLHKLASMWHWISPSYNTKVSIYRLTYWCI